MRSEKSHFLQKTVSAPRLGGPARKPTEVAEAAKGETLKKEEMPKNLAYVKKENYHKINVGDHIKYRNTKDKVCLGGYIWSISEKAGRKFWMVGQTPDIQFANRYIMRFALYWDKVKTLWCYIPYDTQVMNEVIMRMQVKMNALNKFMVKKYGPEYEKFAIAYVQEHLSSH